jgi:hypothetical protein
MNLVVKMKLMGEAQQRVCAVSRLKVDGQGRLTLIDRAGTFQETFAMADVEFIRIVHVTSSLQAA